MDLFKQLRAYSLSYELALEVYEQTKGMPKDETYGLVSQMRRASMSIPATIAEGYAKKASEKEFRRYLMMALGSCNEMKVWLDMSKDLKFAEKTWCETVYEKYDQVGGLIMGIVKKLSVS